MKYLDAIKTDYGPLKALVGKNSFNFISDMAGWVDESRGEFTQNMISVKVNPSRT